MQAPAVVVVPEQKCGQGLAARCRARVSADHEFLFAPALQLEPGPVPAGAIACLQVFQDHAFEAGLAGLRSRSAGLASSIKSTSLTAPSRGSEASACCNRRLRSRSGFVPQVGADQTAATSNTMRSDPRRSPDRAPAAGVGIAASAFVNCDQLAVEPGVLQAEGGQCLRYGRHAMRPVEPAARKTKRRARRRHGRRCGSRRISVPLPTCLSRWAIVDRGCQLWCDEPDAPRRGCQRQCASRRARAPLSRSRTFRAPHLSLQPTCCSCARAARCGEYPRLRVNLGDFRPVGVRHGVRVAFLDQQPVLLAFRVVLEPNQRPLAMQALALQRKSSLPPPGRGRRRPPASRCRGPRGSRARRRIARPECRR